MNTNSPAHESLPAPETPPLRNSYRNLDHYIDSLPAPTPWQWLESPLVTFLWKTAAVVLILAAWWHWLDWTHAEQLKIRYDDSATDTLTPGLFGGLAMLVLLRLLAWNWLRENRAFAAGFLLAGVLFGLVQMIAGQGNDAQRALAYGLVSGCLAALFILFKPARA